LVPSPVDFHLELSEQKADIEQITVEYPHAGICSEFSSFTNKLSPAHAHILKVGIADAARFYIDRSFSELKLPSWHRL